MCATDTAEIPSYNKQARILVVEDNPINQQVARLVFESVGVVIDMADTGECAVQMVSEIPYELIFMDLHLPGIDGFEATRQILNQSPNIPVVALSADVFAQYREQANQTGISDALSKPIDKQELIRILHRFVPE